MNFACSTTSGSGVVAPLAASTRSTWPVIQSEPDLDRPYAISEPSCVNEVVDSDTVPSSLKVFGSSSTTGGSSSEARL